MKNKFLKLSLIFSVFALIVSCDDDNDYAGESTTQATDGNATITLAFDATQSFVEKNEVYTYTVTLSEPQIADVKIPVTFVGGTATEHSDFDFDHELKISRSTMSAVGTITVYRDEDVEDTETLSIQIGAPSEEIANVIITPQVVNFTMEDQVICHWTLEATDTYGDGWNAAAIRLTADGVVTDYANDDPDGEVGSETQTINIPIDFGAVYSLEFVSGAWDGEIEYILTAPDGTVYESTGGYPAVGEITSGISNCI